MTKFIALVSGKGGVGKTTAVLNLGQALTDLGRKVILLDGNLATPNLAILLGFMNPEGTVNKFLRKEQDLQEVIYEHECGLKIIPASPSYLEYQNTNPELFSSAFERLEEVAEFVLIDAPSGLDQGVQEIIKNCDEVIVVVNPTYCSVIDGLKTIKLAQMHTILVAGVILNMSHKGRNEIKPKEIEEILGHHLLANVQYSRKVRKSIHHNLPLNYLYPYSKAAKEFKSVASLLSLEEKK